MAEELDGRSRISTRLPETGRAYKYRLQDRALWRHCFDAPIFTMATRAAGDFVVSHGASRFATQVTVEGGAGDLFCFTTQSQGDLTLLQPGRATTGTSGRGLAWRPGDGTRFLISDLSVRSNVFVKASEVERALEHMLDQHLPRPLEFRPSLDWTSGLLASLKCQLDFVAHEFGRPDGIADNAVALASMTDFLVTLAMRAAPSNYSDQLVLGDAAAVPAYVRRAEEFMRVHGAQPLRVAQIATAAGCSVRTLNTVFRQFRGRTPLAALHAIRLDQVHAELSRGADGATVGVIARRYGFTNATRFSAAFRRRFGESPSAIVRRASRP